MSSVGEGSRCRAIVRGWVLVIGLLVPLSCKDKEQETRIASLESSVAAASSINKDNVAQIQALASAQAVLSSRLTEVERRTPGIGYFVPGWSFQGMRGANSINVRATPVSGSPDHCRISGSFEYSSSLPSPVVLTVFKEGGESAFETSVALAEGAFDVKSIPIGCELVNKVSFAPKQ